MTKHTARTAKLPALTRAEVIHVLGGVDDTAVSAILQTGATYQELEEAQIWALGDIADLGKEGHELSPAAAAVYDILMSDPAFLENERER
jgi:hypothetical protein